MSGDQLQLTGIGQVRRPCLDVGAHPSKPVADQPLINEIRAGAHATCFREAIHASISHKRQALVQCVILTGFGKEPCLYWRSIVLVKRPTSFLTSSSLNRRSVTSGMICISARLP